MAEEGAGEAVDSDEGGGLSVVEVGEVVVGVGSVGAVAVVEGVLFT